MGRTIVTVLVMLVTFAAFAAFFVLLDSASGIRLPVPAPFAAAATTRTPSRTPTPSPRSHTAPARATAPPTAPATAAPARATSASSGVTATATSATSGLTPTATASPVPTATAPAAGTTTATLPATATTPAAATATATPMPTPPGGITPPRYGALPNYPNDTAFSPAFMRTLDQQIIALTNQQRAAHGLSALSENAALDVIAAARSEDLVMRNYFDHYDPTGPLDAQGHHAAAVQELLARNNIAYVEVGENLIGRRGFPLDKDTPAEVVRAWMSHPEHRANILHAAYTSIGVGMAAQNQSTGLRVVITQVFLR